MIVKKSLLSQINSLIFCLVPLLITTNAYSTPASTTWSLEQRTPYNVKIQQARALDYHPLKKTIKPWKICALVPHLKDAYWIGIDYGLVQQAKRLNVTLELFEAGSYYGKKKQLSQLNHCMNRDYDAILLGSVDPKLLSYYHEPITKPVIALVNRIDSPKIKTRVGVSWYQMGWHAGHFIKDQVEQNHSAPLEQATNGEQGQTTLALLTGPEKQGGSDWVEQGIMAALENSRVTISSVRHADNNRNLYRDQLHYLLNDQTPDYILGSAVAIEAAIGEIQHKGVDKQVKLVSSYLSPAVLRGLFRDKVAFSSDDLVVLQGKLAIDVMVRVLEGAGEFGDIGPAIQMLQKDVLNEDILSDSLAPAEFYPIYRVN
ncbi:TMAO reductase system periplasmic protein TorT [uncultured Shewanella sp.]|uniref:TMAO reductase system periplasmic protein TorT n=1 Tax=Shewanella atlantica TaxID=271099 RepID=UPI00262B6E0A|nr:TMAO reductase system periplasmic protein TorT [uncultured Shewanella sp.]